MVECGILGEVLVDCVALLIRRPLSQSPDDMLDVVGWSARVKTSAHTSRALKWQKGIRTWILHDCWEVRDGFSHGTQAALKTGRFLESNLVLMAVFLSRGVQGEGRVTW